MASNKGGPTITRNARANTVVCGLSVGGYFHAGSLRRLLAARQLANDHNGDLVIRVDDYWPGWMEPTTFGRHYVCASGASLRTDHLRQLLDQCGVTYTKMVRLSDLIGQITRRTERRLSELATEVVTIADFVTLFAADGWDRRLVESALLRMGNPDTVAAYRLCEGEQSVLLEQLDGTPGRLVAALFADEAIGARWRIVEAIEAQRVVAVENRLRCLYEDLPLVESVSVPPVEIDSAPVDDDAYPVYVWPPPELAVARLSRIYEGTALVQALMSSLAEDVDDWDEIRDRWLPHHHKTPPRVPAWLRAHSPTMEDCGVAENDGEPGPAALQRPRIRFSPSATGYLHVGNLRTLLAARDMANSLGGDLIVRIDDLSGFSWQDGYMLLATGLRRGQTRLSVDHIRRALHACGVDCAEQHLLSEATGAVTARFGPALASVANCIIPVAESLGETCQADSIRTVLAQLDPHQLYGCTYVLKSHFLPLGEFRLFDVDGVIARDALAISWDTLYHISHAVRGEELLHLAETEQFLCTQLPELNRVESHFVPLLRAGGHIVAKRAIAIGQEEEPETGVMSAIRRYGVTRLTHALRESLEQGVNEWEEVKSRWLDTPGVP